MKTVLSNPSNKEIYQRIERKESNTLSSSGENKREEEEEASALVGMKSALPDPRNKEINKRIETNENNKFSSSGEENKSEEEEVSKSQESREINTNTSSNNKAKSGEHVLNCLQKKPGGRGRSVPE